MALITRISRLFKADFHAVLDHIEEPEQMLRQAIRDMEDDLVQAEQRIALCSHEQDTFAVRKSELGNAISNIDSELDLCFESDNEDLARGLVRKKLEAERLLKRLESKLGANEQYLVEQRKLLDENTATLDSLRQKAELLSQRPAVHGRSGAEIDDMAWAARDMTVGDDEIEIAFLREKSLRGAS